MFGGGGGSDILCHNLWPQENTGDVPRVPTPSTFTDVDGRIRICALYEVFEPRASPSGSVVLQV